MPRFASAVAFSMLLSCLPMSAEEGGQGTLILDDDAISMVAAFAYTGEQADYDENGKRLDHYELLLVGEPFEGEAILASDAPVSNFNEWLYVEEPAALEIHLDPSLTPTFFQANVKGRFHADRVRCACEGITADVKLVDGRLRGRITSGNGLRWPDDGTEDPSGGRKLAFDVTFDVPVARTASE